MPSLGRVVCTQASLGKKFILVFIFYFIRSRSLFRISLHYQTCPHGVVTPSCKFSLPHRRREEEERAQRRGRARSRSKRRNTFQVVKCYIKCNIKCKIKFNIKCNIKCNFREKRTRTRGEGTTFQVSLW